MILAAFVPQEAADTPTPPSCKPFTFQSGECVGDLISVGVCGVAAIGFVIWGIHAIRKMRNDPFNEDEDNEESEDIEKANRNHGPPDLERSLLVLHGVEPLSMPERVRTRLAEEESYQASAPILYDAYPAQGLMTASHAPRFPPPAAPPARGQSRKSSLRRSGREGGLPRGKAYSEGYEHRVDVEYVSRLSPSRARESRLYEPGGGYGSARFMGNMNENPKMGRALSRRARDSV